MKYVVANWKSHFTVDECGRWWDDFLSYDFKNIDDQALICIICPPFHLLDSCNRKAQAYPWIKIGTQDISQYPSGTYTGEVAAELTKDIAPYTLIGHSERRNQCNETTEIIQKKYDRAIENTISPLVFIQQSHDITVSNAPFYVYEPQNAISTGDGHGHNDTLEDILAFKKQANLPQDSRYLYGGSVNEDNIRQYVTCDELDGFVVGGASLDPLTFYTIVNIMAHS